MSGTTLFDAAVPLIAAPMAGGPSTVALAAAVLAAGSFPFLATGNKTATALAHDISQSRELLAPGANFGVNLFVPSPGPIDTAELTSML